MHGVEPRFTIHYSLFTISYAINFRKNQRDWLAFAKLPREPMFKVLLQCPKVNAKAHFDRAIGHGKTLIKSRAPCKTPHEVAIQPTYGAGARPMEAQYLHLDSACEHRKLSSHYLPVKKENHLCFLSCFLKRMGGGWRGIGMSLIMASGFFFNSLSAVSSPMVSATLR